MKRFLDFVAAAFGLLIASPILLTVMLIVWSQDGYSPFYIAPRVGKNGQLFYMVKLRSMVANADKSGVDSTGSTDIRITPIGHFIRRYKLDELTQLWNVLKGDMSLVGPRPNVQRETDLYTDIEKKLLSVRPGITDFSSIIFSDEGDILKGKEDPDLAYNQLIRPWKSRLGLVYVDSMNILLDIKLILLTVVAIFSRDISLASTNKLLIKLDVDPKLIKISLRDENLVPTPPPGLDVFVVDR